MLIQRRGLVAATMAAATLAVPATASAAEGFVGVTASNQVVQFASDSPGNIKRSLPIRGLQAGERIVGLDVRPATGQLYALGTSSRLYTLEAASGLTRQVGGGPFSPSLRGSFLGFDFNPTVDRIRLVSEARQNLRLNPNTASAVVDGDLVYAAGDAGAGTAPAVSAAAYTNSVPGATSTTLFGIDTARDALVRIDPPNGGVLNTVGEVGIEVSPQASFDIVPGSNAAYAVLDATSGVNPDTDGPGPRLYRIDLATGDAAPTQARGRNQVGTFRGRRRVIDNLVALASVGTVPDDGERPTVVADSRQRFSRTRALPVRVSTSEAASITVRLVIRGRTYARRTGEVRGGAGSTVVRPRLGRNGRRVVRRRDVRGVRLVVGARDASGKLARATTRTIAVR